MSDGERIVHLQVDEAGERLDRYLVRVLPRVSRSLVQRLIRQGLVELDGKAAKPSMPVRPGMRVMVRIPPPPSDEVPPQPIPLDVVYEDDDLLVVNKPAGMVVHPVHPRSTPYTVPAWGGGAQRGPAGGYREGTLVNALLARYPGLDVGEAGRPGIVHRLDRDTSGLIVVAKTEAALGHLRRQFKSRGVKKTYLALVHGRPPVPEGIIEAPIGRDPRQRKRMAVVGGGRAARTRYHLLEGLGDYSLLVVLPETGRTHQIRVHLAWLEIPVAGDRVYGRGRGDRRARKDLGLTRQFLHAWRLSFKRVGGRGTLDLEAPLPADLQEALRALGADWQRMGSR